MWLLQLPYTKEPSVELAQCFWGIAGASVKRSVYKNFEVYLIRLYPPNRVAMVHKLDPGVTGQW